MMAHVWDTFVVTGFTGTAAAFVRFGIPIAILAAAFTLVVELISSVLLILGVFIWWAAGLLSFVMAGAIYFVHAPHGIFVKNNGWELVGMVIAAVLAVAVAGPGRLSIDYLRSRTARRADAATAPHRVVARPVSTLEQPRHDLGGEQRANSRHARGDR